MFQSERSTNPIDAESLAFLRRHGREVSYGEGERILARGEPGRAFFVVLDGEVEVLLEGEDKPLQLARLGPGASFGEMALLRGGPVSADVVAKGEVRVLEVPAADFKAALTEHEALRVSLLTRLADDLHHTTSDAWSFFRRSEALEQLSRDDQPEPAMVAASARMRAVEKRIQKLATTSEPVLIVGEPGTGKRLAAGRLHELSGHSDSPLVVVDCRHSEAYETRRLVFDAGSELGRGGTLVLRQADALDGLLQQELCRALFDGGGPRFRLIATCRSSAESDEGLIGEIRRRGAVLELPRLVDCRRDIIPMAQHFLDECGSADDQQLTMSARYAVAQLRYRRRNVAQLKETIQLAALCADGSDIRAEHIFTAPGELPPTGIHLAGLRRLAGSRSLSLVKGAVLVGFAAVILLCLVAASSAAGRTANALIWGLWEPAVFGLFLLVGRVWCTVCPLSTAGRISQRVFTLGRPPPDWLDRFWVWLATLGFFLIVWAERVFEMSHNPPASAVLLLVLIGLSVAFCLVYQREVFCRSVCPLGTLGAGLSPPAPLHLAATSSVCASSCTTHDCYKGRSFVPGCTVFHHPLEGSQAHLCKLCLDCLESCPHDSARVYLRAPLTGVWRLGTAAGRLAPFLVSVALLSLLLLAAQATELLDSWWLFTAAGLLTLAAGALLSRALPRLLPHYDREDSPVPAQTAFALLVLGWGALMAYQFGNVAALDGIELNINEEAALSAVLPERMALQPLVQASVVLLAALLAAVTLERITAHARDNGVLVRRLPWRLLVSGCLLYVAAALALILIP